MGMGPAIIINPKSMETDSPVDVTVSGLVNQDGDEVELRYTVNFFTMSSGGSSRV